MSQALDLVFSHSSLYLIWRDEDGLSNHNLITEEGFLMTVWISFSVWVHSQSEMTFCACICEKLQVNLHHCTRQRWLWPFWFGAGLGRVCTDVSSFRSLLCNFAEEHINNWFVDHSHRRPYLVWNKKVLTPALIISHGECWLYELTLLTSWAFFLARRISGVSVTGLYFTWSICCL